ncbi:hypothetical protein [Herbaspirillum sp. 1130]|uniref:hypothetical protein n=1 Tax=Herbaspirillum sp. 1130 TaxID=2806562 RepID=UPI001AE93DD3|nr:hypothetical protein [Herbaspirillum sp. 1130]MBP1314280.1 hypothetical protein [Herbaspirillum sp. 1130]
MPSPDIANGVLKGTIDATGVKVFAVSASSRVNLTATLKSGVTATRKIELSADGGDEFFPVDYDVTTATMLVLAIGTPISHIRFTGAAGDTWSVR